VPWVNPRPTAAQLWSRRWEAKRRIARGELPHTLIRADGAAEHVRELHDDFGLSWREIARRADTSHTTVMRVAADPEQLVRFDHHEQLLAVRPLDEVREALRARGYRDLLD
jgi:DNA invertase Pin-like site-specific DNA recombinase